MTAPNPTPDPENEAAELTEQEQEAASIEALAERGIFIRPKRLRQEQTAHPAGRTGAVSQRTPAARPTAAAPAAIASMGDDKRRELLNMTSTGRDVLDDEETAAERNKSAQDGEATVTSDRLRELLAHSPVGRAILSKPVTSNA